MVYLMGLVNPVNRLNGIVFNSVNKNEMQIVISDDVIVRLDSARLEVINSQRKKKICI